jgi:hypothetical protein
MAGGAHRGPVGLQRQRRTIRFVQLIIVAVAAGLLLFAGYSLGQSSGYDRGTGADELGAPDKPAAAQTIILVILGLGALGAALAIQSEGGVRLLTPARLRDMELRGEGAPIMADDEPPIEPLEPSGPTSRPEPPDEGGTAGPPRG